MARALTSQDTTPWSAIPTAHHPMMGGMILTAVPDWEDPQDEGGQVHHLPHPLDPTPEETAAKKARRRLDHMDQGVNRAGRIRPHYFNEAGFDIWGRDERGNYDPAQDTTIKREGDDAPSLPNPFTR